MYGRVEVQLHTLTSALVSFMLWLLYSWGESPQYPLDRSLGGPQSQSVHGGKDKENPFPTPASNVILVIQPVA